MEREPDKNKVEVIYELREATETKVLAELAVDADSTPAARDALLDAQLALEAKTQDAIDVCHECSDQHPAGEPHRSPRIADRRGNVVAVDFRPEAR